MKLTKIIDSEVKPIKHVNRDTQSESIRWDARLSFLKATKSRASEPRVNENARKLMIMLIEVQARTP